MRILALTNLYPNPLQPQRGQFNRQQFRAIAATAAVRVISPVSWVDELGERWRSGRRLEADRQVDCDGLHVAHPRYVYTPKVLRGRHGQFFRWSIRPAFDRAVEEFRPDLVYTCWAYPDGWASIDLARRRRLPVVIKVHGSDILTLLTTRARRRATAEALCAADAVVAVSHDLAERVIRLGVDPERVEVVYDGIDRRLFSPGDGREARRRLQLDQDEPVVLFVGNLVPVKGLDVLVEACNLLAKRGVRFTCILIGRGPLDATLRRETAQRGLSDRVLLLGPRAHADLPDWFRAADVFVLPSRSEGVPNVLLEAAACGTPFVASRVGGIPELTSMGPNRLVTPGCPAELADAIEEQLTKSATPWHSFRPWHSHEEAAGQLVSLFERIIGRDSTIRDSRWGAAASTAGASGLGIPASVATLL